MFRIPTPSKASRRLRTRFSAEGNRARDQRAWKEAADFYRSHLLLVPHDAAIWVQLGHMLKEAGDRAGAIVAYRGAWQLRPDDGDALLHYGHSLLSSGDKKEGLIRLRESAAAGNSQAGRDLGELGEPFMGQGTAAVGPEARRTLAALSEHSAGLQATDFSGVEVLDDRIRSTSNDPWVVFEWKDGRPPASQLALLTIEMPETKGAEATLRTTGADGSVAVHGQIYADLGEGFAERRSTKFPFADGKVRILLVEPAQIRRLRFDPCDGEGVLPCPRLSIAPVGDMGEIEPLVRACGLSDEDEAEFLRLLREVHEDGPGLRPLPPAVALTSELAGNIDFGHDYHYWLMKNAAPDEADYRRIREMDAALAVQPRFSFVMPTYDTPDDLLRECLDSLLAQTYENFEICIADDNSPSPTVAATLAEYAARDARLKFVTRPVNGHISAASNSALELATGDFVVLVDHDDLIPDYTLSVVAQYLARYPDADILFSDEDKITTRQYRLAPYFKGTFNRHLMYGHNMVSHLGVYRRTLVESVGGFRLGLEGSQDYDLLLRCFERSDESRVVHIPHVLYQWRIIPGSTAMSSDQKSYAVIAAQNAINGHFERQGIPLRSVDGFAPGCTAVRPSRTFRTPVSIIIPTRNGLDVLRPCVESIFARDHANAELIVVDNGSDDPETLAYLGRLAEREDVRVLTDPGEFNFSRINNEAAAVARGEILCFLNNDTEVISADWLNRARTFLSMDDIGMVGARLLFPDGALQHFGIVLGMGEHHVAGTPHLGIDGNWPGYFSKARLLQEVSAVTAACMFMRKADFDAVGGFEEALRVAYNDVDLCLKVRERGLKILADPDILLTHKESRTRGSDQTGAKAQRLNDEAAWMRARWAAQLDNDPYYSPNHDLTRGDFAYAARPRAPWPWQDGWRSAPAGA